VLGTTLLTVVPVAALAGRGMRIGTVAALNLAQISEFSLVIVAVGVAYEHVNEELQTLVLVSMLMAAVLSTYAITYSAPLARWLLRGLARLGADEARAEGAGPDGAARDIVLLGCFREGLALLDRIDEQWPDLRGRVAVLDFNPELREVLEPRGYDWRYADLGNAEALSHLGIGHANLVIASIPDSFLKGTSNLEILRRVAPIAPHARLVMTAETEQQAEELLSAGAHEAVVVSRAAGDCLFDALSRWPGVVAPHARPG
jgi:CheY-like chemotaxis protein